MAAEHVVRPEFVPDPGMSQQEMEAVQHDIADAAVFEDRFSFPQTLEDVVVAGVDQAFQGDDVISGVVVMRNGEVIERAAVRQETRFPYIPGLLSFREGNAILSVLQELDTDPELLVVDGSGRIHFREAGIATHIGVLLDIPSIGVAKKLLCGESKQPLNDRHPIGTRIPIMADDSVTAPDGAVIGYAFQSKQYESGNRHVNPLFVSPGHRCSAETAVDMVEQLCNGYKLPEPTRRADRYVDTVKKQDESQQDFRSSF